MIDLKPLPLSDFIGVLSQRLCFIKANEPTLVCFAHNLTLTFNLIKFKKTNVKILIASPSPVSTHVLNNNYLGVTS